MKIQDRPVFRSKPAPFMLRADAIVSTAIETMTEKNIGSVVIVDEENKVKGIVTERDILRRLLGKGLDPRSTPLSKIMTSEVRVARAEDDVIDWLRQMSNERFRHVPVVDASGRLLHVMSQGDFVSYTWPDLVALLGDKARETLKRGNPQIVTLALAALGYAGLIAAIALFRR